MFSALLNIVIPVFAVVGLGALYGRLRPGGALGYVNRANIELFTPALVFSALVKYPLDLMAHLSLIAAGALVILLPGLLLSLLRLSSISRPALILPAMFRNTGNLGIPLMVLAFGEQQLGAIIILFVLSNLLHFSVGMFILSANTSRWLWLRSPVLWAALAGLLVANLHIPLPEYLVTSASLLGQISVPLMLFALGIRLMEGELDHLVYPTTENEKTGSSRKQVGARGTNSRLTRLGGRSVGGRCARSQNEKWLRIIAIDTQKMKNRLVACFFVLITSGGLNRGLIPQLECA